jgi:tetratricopeptide (TPR) repeat protein
MKLNENSYIFAKKLLELNKKEENKEDKDKEKLKEINKEKEIDQRRIVGGTDYKKFEEINLETENEEIKKEKDERTKEALKMGCNNDFRKERQLMDKPTKDKIDACKLFKNEGDDLLKEKKFDEAIKSYEKALLQLFYTFPEDPEEDKIVDKLKSGINMNISMCKINLGKYDDAINNCLEALRFDNSNLKAIYRIAFSYFKIEKFDKAKEYINDALKIEPKEKLFLELRKNIEDKEKENDLIAARMFKKILK